MSSNHSDELSLHTPLEESQPDSGNTAGLTRSFSARLSTNLRVRVGAENFERWFSGVEVEANGDGAVILRVPNPINQFWIESNYSTALQEAVEDEAGGPREIAFEVRQDSAEQTKPAPVPHIPAVKAARLISADAAGEGRAGVLFEEARPPRAVSEAGLSTKYSFENFVIGNNSSYSCAVARAVAEKPGRIYNPLFFYGDSGLGKTHLMQAIGREILSQKKKATVRYVTCEQFTNDFVEAIKNQTLSQFRRKYRGVDVLLIDDVHFLVGKDSTQEEFFHTFNELFNNSKQLVLASDRAPGALKGLEQRLVSRFEWGLTSQIQTPDFETRVAILRRKMADISVALDPWVLEFIAQRVRSNVRKLEGALMQVAAHVSLTGSAGDETALERLLKDVLDHEPTKAIAVDAIQKMVAEHYDLRVSDITGPRRTKNIAEARHVAMYLTRHLTKLPLTQIGEEFGARDHGTVIHACKVVAARIQPDEQMRRTVEVLMARITDG
jgi:chromosomal replication initiator protein